MSARPQHTLRCEACGDLALATQARCAKCVAWTSYGEAIDSRADPIAFASGVQRFQRYLKCLQPDACLVEIQRMRRRLDAMERALGW